MNPASTPRRLARWPLHLHAMLRAERKRALMALLALITGVEFFENVMFVFGASHIVGGVDAAPRDFAYAQAAYAIGSMLMIVQQQWLAARHGYRRYLIASLSLFILGTLGCALSDNLTQLATARLVQGFGGGALFTSCRVLLNLMFAPAERPRASKYFMMGIFGASAIAPALAAELVEAGGWRWIFVGALAPAILALLATWLLLPSGAGRDTSSSATASPAASNATATASPAARWPVAPLMLFAIAILSLQLAASELRYDIFNQPTRLLAMTLAGAVLFGAFLWHQWRHPSPVLRLRELRSPVYLTGLGLYFLHYFLSNFAGYLFPVYTQQALGFSVQASGWLNTGSALISLAAAFLYVRYAKLLKNKKPLMAVGGLLMVVSSAWFSLLPPGVSPAQLWPGLIAKGLFGVLLILPVAGLTFRELGDARFGHGYQVKNLMRQMAGSLSSALAAALLQNRTIAVQDQLSATLTPDHPAVAESLARMQEFFLSQGYSSAQAQSGALAELSHMVAQQAQLIACENLYQWLAMLALLTVAVVLAQKRIRG